MQPFLSELDEATSLFCQNKLRAICDSLNVLHLEDFRSAMTNHAQSDDALSIMIERAVSNLSSTTIVSRLSLLYQLNSVLSASEDSIKDITRDVANEKTPSKFNASVTKALDRCILYASKRWMNVDFSMAPTALLQRVAARTCTLLLF